MPSAVTPLTGSVLVSWTLGYGHDRLEVNGAGSDGAGSGVATITEQRSRRLSSDFARGSDGQAWGYWRPAAHCSSARLTSRRGLDEG